MQKLNFDVHRPMVAASENSTGDHTNRRASGVIQSKGIGTPMKTHGTCRTAAATRRPTAGSLSNRLASLLAGCAAVAVVLLLSFKWGAGDEPIAVSAGGGPAGASGVAGATVSGRRFTGVKPPALPPGTSAGEVVRGKVIRYAQKRERVARRMAAAANVTLSPEVEHFFEAARGDRWDELNSTFQALAEKLHNPDTAAALRPVWPAIQDVFGAAEQARNWPATQLLEYGDSVLQALKPGAVYIGGTDPGRWIPALMNDSAEGDAHVMLSQNALADQGYMDYVRELYGSSATFPSAADAEKAFADYLADATRRAQHDNQFPGEPPQLRPGETVTTEPDGRVSIGGAVSVMGINELLLQRFLALNPSAPIVLEESYPLSSLYADAVPAGPVLELRAPGAGSPLPAEVGADVVARWQDVLAQVNADPAAQASTTLLDAYARDAVTQGSLLAARGLADDAEATYRLALAIDPSNRVALAKIVEQMAATGRADAALQWLNSLTPPTPEFGADVTVLKGALAGAAGPKP
jgi:hypothetical protein